MPDKTKNLAQLLEQAADVFGQRPAFVDAAASAGREDTLSFADWHARSSHLGHDLKAMGIGPGHLVAAVMGSSLTYPVCYTATATTGAAFSGIHKYLDTSEIGDCLDTLDPTLILIDTDVELPERHRDRALALEDLTLDRAGAGALASPGPTNADLADITCVVWTSGTTGRPRGAMFDDRALEFVASTFFPLIEPADRYMAALPLTHGNFMTKVAANLILGFTQVLPPLPWTYEKGLETIIRHEVTVAGAISTQWQLILEHAPADLVDQWRLRRVVLGGEEPDEQLIEALATRLRLDVVVRFTSTEAAVCSGTRLTDDRFTVAQTVGRPYDGVQIRITDDQGADITATGRAGFIECRSPAVTRGYYGEDSSEILRGDGYVYTADYGQVDEGGNLRLCGRERSTYYYDGEDVFPLEVERLLVAHPLVRSTAIVGRPDTQHGEVGVAFVVLDAEVSASGWEDDLLRWLAPQLPDYKLPHAFAAIDQLPVTMYHKIDRSRLGAMARGLA